MQRPLCVRVLVAEDNVINQKLFARMLSLLSIEAEMVDSGPNALQACRQKGYDMVLMDYQMPGTDGVETAMEIKRSLQGQKPIIILMSANLLVNSDYLLHPGVIDGFLKNPFTLQELKELIEKWQPVFAATSG